MNERRFPRVWLLLPRAIRMEKLLAVALRRNLRGGRVLGMAKHRALPKHGRAVDRVRRALLCIFLALYACFAGPDLLELFNQLIVPGRTTTGRVGAAARGLARIGSAAHHAVSEELFAPQPQVKRFVDKSVLLSDFSGSNMSDFAPDVKIYVYDLPSRYNTDWLQNSRCSIHLFAAEVAIHHALLNSSVRVMDPWKADFFFVPVYVSCNFSTINGFPAIGHARGLLSSAVQLLSRDLPFWNRSAGADHVFVATHDYGACFHAMEDVARADGIPDFMRKSIILQTFGVEGRHPCQDVEHIQIPPYVPPESIQALWPSASLKQKRDIFAFFRGKMEIHPKNISGRVYSKGVRTAIWQRYSRNRKFYIKRKRYEGYQQEILRSVFCLCPLGWAPWSPRVVEAVALGCVPVIIADDIRLPYADAVPWERISLRVAQQDVARLGRILERVAATNVTTIQRYLWNDTLRRALLFTLPSQPGDATWHVLRGLARRRRRLRVSEPRHA